MEEKTLLAFAKWMQSKDEKLAKVPVEHLVAKVAEAMKTPEGKKQLASLFQQFQSEVSEIMRSGGKMECAVKNIEHGAKLQNGGMISEKRMARLFDKAGVPALNSDSANYFLENGISRKDFRHRMQAARNRGIEGRDNRISFALTGNEPVSDADNGVVWKTDPSGNKSLTGRGQRWLNKGYISTMSGTDNIDRNVFRERMSDLRDRGVRGRGNRIRIALSPTVGDNIQTPETQQTKF